MLIDFMLAYWHLFAMLVVVVFLLALNPGAGSKKVSPLQLPQLQTREAAVVLDVCEPEAFKQGHIEQAINLPLGQIKERIAKLNKHKSKPIIVACQNAASQPRRWRFCAGWSSSSCIFSKAAWLRGARKTCRW